MARFLAPILEAEELIEKAVYLPRRRWRRLGKLRPQFLGLERESLDAYLSYAGVPATTERSSIMTENTSSPLSSPPTSQLPPPSTPRPLKAYRPARALPFELNSQIAIYFEENLYTQALALLQSLVSSSTHTGTEEPTFVPSSTQLALASTLIVHPALTTRTTSKEKWSQAASALRLLRVVSQVVGPVNADFRNAFKFLRFRFGSTRNSGGNVLRNSERRQATEERSRLDDVKIENQYAQDESLYSHAEDFWHVVGWAFSCSKLHPKRWERWVLWLDWMIDVLEDDWHENEESDVKRSLTWSYVSHASGGRGRNRRILRSIFANGTTKAVNEFREVFIKELREPKKEHGERIKKREVDVNVEAEVYGDYMAKEEDERSEDELDVAGFAKRTRTRDPSLRSITSKASVSSLNSAYDEGEEEGEDGPAVLGGSDSLRLRMRLLQLLSDVSLKLPDDFETGNELYTMFVEFIRPLPLATFQAIISPSAVPDMFSADAQTTLCEFLLTRSLLEAAAPDTAEPYLRQSKMEECYLPFAATSSSVADNAKVSLCLETLLRHLLVAGKLTARPALELAIQDGIQKRCEKASDGVKKSASARRKEEIAWAWLLESGERLTDILKRVRP